MAKKKKNTQFAVLGLGRFGMSVAESLAEEEVNILVCDKESFCLGKAAAFATHAVQGDISDEATLKKLGLGNFDVVIIAIGEGFEATLIAAMTAKELGAPYVVAKAKGERQKKILESIGVDLVVLPEKEMGAKIARRLLNTNLLDVLEESGEYIIAEMRPEEEWVGNTIRHSDIRRKHGMMILAIRSGKQLILPVPPDYVIQEGDVLITIANRK